MNQKHPRKRIFPSAHVSAEVASRPPGAPHCQSPSYRLAFQDPDFLLRDELRPVRLQLELLKPELILQEHGIDAAVVVFGSARIPEPAEAEAALRRAEEEVRQAPGDRSREQALQVGRRRVELSRYYEEARRLGRLVADGGGPLRLVVMTGGGPGIMEAANRGAREAGGGSVGMNIVLPHEQLPNPYIQPELNFQFHYFAIRKMHLLMRARALAVFPGGFGTLDELFETLTLIQTGKVRRIPVLLFGREFWRRLVDFDLLVAEGMIAPADLELMTYVETAEEAWEIIGRANDERRENGPSR